MVGAEFTEVTESIWRVTRGNAKTTIAAHVTEADNPVVLEIAGDKELMIGIATECGVPVPTVGSYTLEDTNRVVGELPWANGSFVVKPAGGSSSGVGITTHIETPREYRKAALLASLFADRFLVERMIAGESCRLLFLEGKFVHAVRRRGERVSCDGKSTLEQLIRTSRGGGSRKVRDRTTAVTLAQQGLGFDTVPREGLSILTRSIPLSIVDFNEVRTEYNETITDLVGPALVDELGKIVARLDGKFVGVDILTIDPSVSLAQSGGVFLEVNTTPGIHHHYHNDHDRAEHPVAARLLERLLIRSELAGAESETPLSGEEVLSGE